MQRKVPLPGKIFARCILQRRFAGRFGCMARISCQSQPVFGCMARESCRELAIFPSETAFGMHGAQNLPRIAARERISRAFCHRQAPGNAPRRNLATARHSGTHRGGILSRQGPRERTARVYCHCQPGQERIRAQSCHRRTLGNASCEHFAIVERPGNAYSQRLANRAASSCGRAYCLAIALVPHESDGLFVQAVLCA